MVASRYHDFRLCCFFGFGLKRPPNGRFADFVLQRQLSHRLASSVTLGDLPLLAGIEARRAAELRAPSLGSLDSLIASLADQAALKLRNPAHDGQHQPADI